MMQDIRWKQRFNNYVKALDLLERVSEGVTSDDEVGTLASIQAFEMVVELGWNLLKDIMHEDGLSVQPAPKPTIREAFKRGYIADGEVWTDAVQQRNLTAHTYNHSIAEQLLDDIQHQFLPGFRRLRQTVLKMTEQDE